MKKVVSLYLEEELIEQIKAKGPNLSKIMEGVIRTNLAASPVIQPSSDILTHRPNTKTQQSQPYSKQQEELDKRPFPKKAIGPNVAVRVKIGANNWVEYPVTTPEEWEHAKQQIEVSPFGVFVWVHRTPEVERHNAYMALMGENRRLGKPAEPTQDEIKKAQKASIKLLHAKQSIKARIDKRLDEIKDEPAEVMK